MRQSKLFAIMVMAVLLASLAFAQGGKLTGDPETTTRMVATTPSGNVTVTKEVAKDVSTSSSTSAEAATSVSVSASSELSFSLVPVEQTATPANPAPTTPATNVDITPNQVTILTKQEPNITNLYNKHKYVTKTIRTEGLTATQLTDAIAAALKNGYVTRDDVAAVVAEVLDSRKLATKANLDEAQKAIIAKIGDPAQRSDIKDLRRDIQNWGWLWALAQGVGMILAGLLGTFLIIALIGLLLSGLSWIFSRIFGGTTSGWGWNWFWWRKPVVVEPVLPIVEPLVVQTIPLIMSNTHATTIYGKGEPSTVDVVEGKGIIAVRKGIADIANGGDCQWADEGKKISIPGGDKGVLRFALQFKNTGKIDVRTDGMILQDKFLAITRGIFMDDTGIIWIGMHKRKNADGTDYRLPNELVKRILSGEKISFEHEIADQIPANSSVTITYDIYIAPPNSDDDSFDFTDKPTIAKNPIFNLEAYKAEQAEIAAEKTKAEESIVNPIVNSTPTNIEKAAIVEDLCKEVISSRPISDEFRAHLQTLETSNEAKVKLMEYRNINEAIAGVDITQGKRPYWQEVNRLANEVVMGRMTLDQAKAEREKAVTTTTSPKAATTGPNPGGATGAAFTAAAGLLDGMADTKGGK